MIGVQLELFTPKAPKMSAKRTRERTAWTATGHRAESTRPARSRVRRVERVVLAGEWAKAL